VKLDVALSPADLADQDLAGRAAFVIDILRATTTICAALSHGAQSVAPCASVADAQALAASIGADAVLAGEQGGLRIPGFALGNSPGEMSARAVQGRVLVMSTANGTPMITAVAARAREVNVLAAVNFTIMVEHGRAILEGGGDLAVICSGRQGEFGLDDAYAAGRFVKGVLAGRTRRAHLNDGALAALQLARQNGNSWQRALRRSAAGRHLIGIGLGEDIRVAGRQDEFPVLARVVDSRVVMVPRVRR
jgi:2-phosphosulfolactate phosphatase